MKLYADQISQLLATENNLRSQLTADGEKFQQFQVNQINFIFFANIYSQVLNLIHFFSDLCLSLQDALLKSNEVFETFKIEIEKVNMFYVSLVFFSPSF